MTIRFAGHDFDGPFRAAWWIPPSYGGVYAVLVEDASYKPLPYRVIHFAQAESFCLLVGRIERGSYVATHPMPGASELVRLALERYLIHYYQSQRSEALTAWDAR